MTHLAQAIAGEMPPLEDNTTLTSKLATDKSSNASLAGAWVIVTLILILLTSVLINFKVLYKVWLLPRRRRKQPATVLVGHLSTVAIILACLSVLLVADSTAVVNLRGQGVCEFINVFKNTILGLFSLNVIAIVFERFRVFNRFNWGKLLTVRVILLVWSISLVFSLPTVLTVEFVPKSVETAEADNIIQVKRGFCKGAIPSSRLRSKIQSVRFIYIHFISFIVIWLPFGFLLLCHRVLTRWPNSTDVLPIPMSILGALLNIYLLLNPLIYLCLMEDMDWCCGNKTGSRETCIRLSQDHPIEQKLCNMENNRLGACRTLEDDLEMHELEENTNNVISHVHVLPGSNGGHTATETDNMSRVSTHGTATSFSHEFTRNPECQNYV